MSVPVPPRAELPRESVPPQPIILVVDDEPQILASLRRLFAFEDWRVQVAADAPQALTMLKRESVAVLMTDQHLGGMPGVELLRQAQELSPATTRILFSGHIDVELLRAAVNGGQVYRFVTKPWDDAEVLAAIRQGVERWRLVTTNQHLSDQAASQYADLGRLNHHLTQLLDARSAELAFRGHALSLAQRVLDRLPVGVMGIDAQRRILVVNLMAQELFPAAVPGELVDGLGMRVANWVSSPSAAPLLHHGLLGDMLLEAVTVGEGKDSQMIVTATPQVLPTEVGTLA